MAKGRTTLVLSMVFLALFLFGCSSSSVSPTLPNECGRAVTDENTSHNTWGLWQFTADPGMGTLDVVQLRTGNFHLNALPFLEPPPIVNLTIESVEFNGNIIDADIGLKHPFLGLTQFTGFDVCGIFITNGTMTGFNDADIIMAGNPEDTYLMNPDGYSPWWNPTNFPYNSANPIFGYTDGLLGKPDSHAHYNTTVCGYKYFADDLDPDESLETLDLDNRGLFSAGKKNIRHYTIHLGTEGLVFNYAVDACWKFPLGEPPWVAPDSFPIEANRPEAFYISIVETENSLFYIDGSDNGGVLGLDVIVCDWQGPDTINSVGVEWPELFGYEETTVPVETTALTATYHFELNGDNLTSTDPVSIFVTAKDIKMHPTLGNIPSYWIVSGFTVSNENPVALEERVVYTAFSGDYLEIFTIDPEGLTEPVKWTQQTDVNIECREPELSPDGQYIVYIRCWLIGMSGYEVRRIDVLTGEDIQLAEVGIDFYWSPSWRHDGQKIVCSYAANMLAEHFIITMDPDGSNWESVDPSGLPGYCPTYSADDQYIYLNRMSTNQIHTYEIASGNLTQFTDNTVLNLDPDCSLDGEKIAWIKRISSGNYEITVSPVSSASPPDKVIPVSSGGECWSTSLSPDSNRVLYQHGNWPGPTITVYDLTDDSSYPLTNGFEPDWGVMLVEN